VTRKRASNLDIALVLQFGHELLQALLEMVGQESRQDIAVATDHSCEKILAHNCFAVMLLIADYLQQNRPGDVSSALLVDDDELGLVQDQVLDIGESDVATFRGVVQASVGVFLDGSDCDHLYLYLVGEPGLD